MRSPADACTGQRTVGPWHLRLPHFRPDRTPASGDELQTEYFVPWEHAPAAIATVTALGAVIRPVLLLTEIRAVAADELWLSPFHGRDSLAIHFSWVNDWVYRTVIYAQGLSARVAFSIHGHMMEL